MDNTIVTQVKRLRPSSSEIVDDFESTHYWQVMLRFWKLPSHIAHFPGANPMSIEEKDFTRLQTDDFLAALKTDGVRHLLLLTTKPNSFDPIAIMIDRAKKMYEVEVWANEDFFHQGSLYDGELVWEADKLVYVVFDVVFVRGVQCARLSYRERMQIVHNTVLCVSDSHSHESIEKMIAEESKFWACNNDHGLRMMPKKCVAKASLKTLWKERGNVNHYNDGIIFTLNSARIETGTSASILKWKPSHSIDVRIVETSSVWQIFANMNNSGELVNITDTIGEYRVQLAPSKLLEAMSSRASCIIECIITVNDHVLTLTPERERTDKTAPNTLNTIHATIRNARENITSEKLISLVQAL